MARKIKNLHVLHQTEEDFKRLKAEYEQSGFTTRMNDGILTVFAKRQPKPKAKKDDKRSKSSD